MGILFYVMIGFILLVSTIAAVATIVVLVDISKSRKAFDIILEQHLLENENYETGETDSTEDLETVEEIVVIESAESAEPDGKGEEVKPDKVVKTRKRATSSDLINQTKKTN